MEHSVKDAVEDLIVGEVIEDYVERIIREAVPVIASAEMDKALKTQDRNEINYAFEEYIDRCLLEVVIENMAKMYEDEEREIHFRE